MEGRVAYARRKNYSQVSNPQTVTSLTPNSKVVPNSNESDLPLLLTLLQLNLHGYHPMGEAERWMETRDPQSGSSIVEIPSDNYFFTLDEIDRGHRARLDRLAGDIATLLPDVAIFEEVGAGSPSTAKDCPAFKDTSGGDRFEKNSVARLQDRLVAKGLPYQLALACRGNVGWMTDATTLADSRILRENAGKIEVVFDYGSNPYPQGMIVEGLAVLVKAPWKIVDQQEWWVPINDLGWNFFTQAVAIEKDGGWILVMNIHGLRKIPHFEAAIAVRSKILDYLKTANLPGTFRGVLIGGDFNADLLSPAVTPWMVDMPGGYDDRSGTPPWQAGLEDDLLSLNSSTDDLGSNITDPTQAQSRVESAIQRFVALQAAWPSNGPSLVMKEALQTANFTGKCSPLSAFQGACSFQDRIDLLFTEPSVDILNSSVIYSQDDWIHLTGPTDHPGVITNLNVH